MIPILIAAVIVKLYCYMVAAGCRKRDAENSSDWRTQLSELQRNINFWGIGALVVVAIGIYLWRWALLVGIIGFGIISVLELIGFIAAIIASVNAIKELKEDILNADESQQDEYESALRNMTGISRLLLSARAVDDISTLFFIFIFFTYFLK